MKRHIQGFKIQGKGSLKVVKNRYNGKKKKEIIDLEDDNVDDSDPVRFKRDGVMTLRIVTSNFLGNTCVYASYR